MRVEQAGDTLRVHAKIVEGDKESKMAGLTQLRKEVIMDMEDFAENEVSAADTPPDSPLPLP